MRRVSQEQDAQRRGAYAATCCDACAAQVVGMTGPGFTLWRRKAGLDRKQCTKKPSRQAPAAPSHLTLDEYTRWLQDALRRERQETKRLRNALRAAARAVERPEENTPPPPPKGQDTYKRLPRKPPVDEDDEELADFNAASPLSGNERLVLKALHAAPDGRTTSQALNEAMSRRSVYGATKRLERRGHLTMHLDLHDTRVRVYRLTTAGRLATASLAPETPA